MQDFIRLMMRLGFWAMLLGFGVLIIDKISSKTIGPIKGKIGI